MWSATLSKIHMLFCCISLSKECIIIIDIERRRFYLHAFKLGTLAWYMAICYKVTQLLSMCTVVFPLPYCLHFWMPTLWQRSLYIWSSRHVAQHPQMIVVRYPILRHSFIVHGFNCFLLKSSPSHHRIVILKWPNYNSSYWTFVIVVLLLLS